MFWAPHYALAEADVGWVKMPPCKTQDNAHCITPPDVDKIVRTLRQLSPKSRIFVIGLYNPYGKGPIGPILTMFVNRWNAMLTQRFANDPNVVVVETYDIFAFRDRLSFDRFHPKDEGYAAIARRIAALNHSSLFKLVDQDHQAARYDPKFRRQGLLTGGVKIVV